MVGFAIASALLHFMRIQLIFYIRPLLFAFLAALMFFIKRFSVVLPLSTKTLNRFELSVSVVSFTVFLSICLRSCYIMISVSHSSAETNVSARKRI